MYPGECGFNGENCTLIETTLENLSDGNNAGSLTDINVRPPHKLNFVASFKSVVSSSSPLCALVNNLS